MSENALERALASLAEHDVDAWRREHVRRCAHQQLSRPTGSSLGNFYYRILEPTLLGILCSVHLAWALAVAATVLR